MAAPVRWLLWTVLCAAGLTRAPCQESREIENRVDSEDLIFKLTPELGALNRAFLRLEIPGDDSAHLFTKEFQFSSDKAKTAQEEHPPLERFVLPARAASLHEYFLRWAAAYEHARVYFIDGRFGKNGNSFESKLGLEALARHKAGHLVSLSGTQEVTWIARSGKWQIARWVQRSMTASKASRLLFSEKLQEALPDRATYDRARASRHEENLVDLFTKDKFYVTKQRYADYRNLDSSYQHPALSVVDIDGDGWDDLYVMGRWGKNQLLVNQRDGTFKDQAAQFGLAIDGLCNCALFADFDNDGDPDAFIGRSLERSLYLENNEGTFRDASKSNVAVPLPFLVSTISAADYNNDGNLDVYLGLYGPTSQDKPVDTWAAEFFPGQKGMQNALREKEAKSHHYLNRLGPPNLLLRNTGGEFRVGPEAAPLAEWHNTYQSAWCDYDNDGDADLYVCNDFAPDHLFRNEGASEPGRPVRFVDVSQEVAGEAMAGFGMGASWGDYDNDGLQDLYVSNMFSKAGRRITSAFPGLDARTPYAAQGSLLFRNTGKRFQQVAGLKAPAIKVAKVGWSFGGQFVDIDNDGDLDLYAASGYYSVPEAIATAQTRDL